MILKITEEERRFRELYRRLRKEYGLWMHLYTSVYEEKDDIIEIWQMEDGKNKETICRVKEKNIEDCYKKAVIDLKHYERKMKAKKACKQVR